MNLRTKALIYKYTHIYLATAEEKQHLAREMTLARAKRMAAEHGETIDTALAVECGMWQAQHGFVRPLSLLRFGRPYWLFDTLAWFHELYLVLKYDLKTLKKRVKNAYNRK